MDPISISVLVVVAASSTLSAVSLVKKVKVEKNKHKDLVAKLKLSDFDTSTKYGEKKMSEFSATKHKGNHEKQKHQLSDFNNHSKDVENEKPIKSAEKAFKKASKVKFSWKSLKAKEKISSQCDGNDDTVDAQQTKNHVEKLLTHHEKFSHHYNDYSFNNDYITLSGEELPVIVAPAA